MDFEKPSFVGADVRRLKFLWKIGEEIRASSRRLLLFQRPAK
jgi:hypothetical protein